VVGAFDGAELVGYFSVIGREPAGSVQLVQLEGGVSPRWHGQGIGSLLVPAMLRQAREVHAARAPDVGVRFDITGSTGDANQAALLAEHGFLPHRWSALMRRDLANLPEVPPLPKGFLLADIDPARDMARLLVAHNEAFQDQLSVPRIGRPTTGGRWWSTRASCDGTCRPSSPRALRLRPTFTWRSGPQAMPQPRPAKGGSHAWARVAPTVVAG
jgi:hypothetical protein